MKNKGDNWYEKWSLQIPMMDSEIGCLTKWKAIMMLFLQDEALSFSELYLAWALWFHSPVVHWDVKQLEGVPQQMQYFHHLRDKSQWGGAPTNAIFLSFERQKSMFTGIGYCQAQSKPWRKKWNSYQLITKWGCDLKAKSLLQQCIRNPSSFAAAEKILLKIGTKIWLWRADLQIRIKSQPWKIPLAKVKTW